MPVDLAGGTAVITGAGSGIGRALAIRLAGRGMHLALLDIDLARLDETADLLPDGAGGTYMVDVRDSDAVDGVARRVVHDLGVPQLLVCGAGVLGPGSQAAWDVPNDVWQRVLDVNFYGTVSTVRSFLPEMVGAGDSAHVVVLSSMAGVLASAGDGPYSVSKHALVAYAETVELDLQLLGASVGVSVVCPGAVLTNLNASVRAGFAGATFAPPMWIEADDVARAVVAGVLAGAPYVFTHVDAAARLSRYQQRLAAAAASLSVEKGHDLGAEDLDA